MQRFNVHHAIITAGALDAATGVNDYNLAEAEFAATVLSRGERAVVITDHSKFGKSAIVNVCGFDALDCLVTDARPPDDLARALATAGVAVEIASTLP